MKPQDTDLTMMPSWSKIISVRNTRRTKDDLMPRSRAKRGVSKHGQ
jgi:hypothetical protein